jgi:Protein of unknown function (DUF3592)
MIRLLTIPFFRFLILFSLVWLALSVVVMVRSRRSASWPRTVGTIVSTEVKRKVSQSLSNDMPVDSVSYEPYVRYAYSVRDRQYEHDKLTTAVTPMIRQSAEAAAILQRYPVGHQITVFYNPADPGDAVLVAGGSSGNWYFRVFGCALFVAAVIGLISQWPR